MEQRLRDAFEKLLLSFFWSSDRNGGMPIGKSYILPDGRFLGTQPLSGSPDVPGHWEVEAEFRKWFFDDVDDDGGSHPFYEWIRDRAPELSKADVDAFADAIGRGDWKAGSPFLEREFGAIRVNASEERYVVIPSTKPTEAALGAFRDWLDLYFKPNDKSLYGLPLYVSLSDAQAGYKGAYGKSYDPNAITPDEVVGRVRRYYSSGTLFEEYVDEPDEGKAIYTTTSPYDVVSRMKASPIGLRILWDRKNDRYYVCDIDDRIHWDMAVAAFKDGYMPNLRGRWQMDGYLDEYGKNVMFYIYAPKGKEDETYGSKVSEDGYEGAYAYDFGTVTTRADDRYKSSPLAKALGKYEAHYVQDGWKDEMTPNVVRAEGLSEGAANGYEVKDREDFRRYMSLVLEGMSDSDVIKECGLSAESEISGLGAFFALRDGTLLSVAENVDLEKSEDTHADLVASVCRKLFDDRGGRFGKWFDDNYGLSESGVMDDDDFSSLCDDADMLGFMTNIKGWLRLNTGTGRWEGRFYCVLPDGSVDVTEEQLKDLEDFLFFGMGDYLEDSVLVYFGDRPVTYELGPDAPYEPEDILGFVRRFYRTGEVTEGRKKADGDGGSEELLEAKADRERFLSWLSEWRGLGMVGLDGTETEGEYFLDRFEQMKQRIKPPYNDYYWWMKNKNQWDFIDYVKDVWLEFSEKEKAAKALKDGAKLIYSDNDWKVYRITSYEASCKYGANTKWCISGSKRWAANGNGRSYWDEYSKDDGVAFYFFIRSNDEKYALSVYPDGNHYEIFDSKDVSVPYIPNAPKIDSIGVDYWTSDDLSLIANAIASNRMNQDMELGAMERVAFALSDGSDGGYWVADSSKPSDVSVVCGFLSDNIPDDYLEYNHALSKDGDGKALTPEEQDVLDEYGDEWGGDIPNLDDDTMELFAYGGQEASKEAVCSAGNPEFREARYFVCCDLSGSGEQNAVAPEAEWFDAVLGMMDASRVGSWSDDAVSDYFSEQGGSPHVGSRQDAFLRMCAEALVSAATSDGIQRSMNGQRISAESIKSELLRIGVPEKSIRKR